MPDDNAIKKTPMSITEPDRHSGETISDRWQLDPGARASSSASSTSGAC
jgi:hypothetical protein